MQLNNFVSRYRETLFHDLNYVCCSNVVLQLMTLRWFIGTSSHFLKKTVNIVLLSRHGKCRYSKEREFMRKIPMGLCFLVIFSLVSCTSVKTNKSFDDF